MHFETRAIHADKSDSPDVAPPLRVSTTFKYPPFYNEYAAYKRGWLAEVEAPPTFDCYSRDSIETRTRTEAVLGELEAAHAVTYSSGLAALSAMFEMLQPKTVILSQEGYHGSHDSLARYVRGRIVKILYLEQLSIDTLQSLTDGLVLLESPQNPRGEVADIRYYRELLNSNVVLAVDGTFCPPPLQFLLKNGADIVMHSCSKYLGGHSDILAGVLLSKNEELIQNLRKDRTSIGNVLGNFESWLLLRSLRTLKVRVEQQSKNAVLLAQWLSSKSEKCLEVVERVWHASLKENPGHEASLRQGPGFSGTLSVEFLTIDHARLLCTNLGLFVNATSLGGCESLIEWRAATDPKISPRLCRISVGLENADDLIDDLRNGLLAVDKILKRRTFS